VTPTPATPATTATPSTSAPAALRIGPIEVRPPVVLAPMAGITNAPFRRLCRSFGEPGGLYVSEMITARGLVERNQKTLRMARFADDEPVRSIQLYGTDPRTVGEAVRFLVDAEGADHVDLNFGCPVAKVTRKGGGAALPVRRALFTAVVRAAVSAAAGNDVPVTVKMRIGVDDGLRTFLDAGRSAADEGVAAVALHGRTAEQHYSGRADWSAIAELKAALADRGTPVLGNGDIWVPADALALRDATGCDGVVVGRGCLGRPWLFRDLGIAFAGGEPPPPPPLAEVGEVLVRHVRLLADWFAPSPDEQAERRGASGTVSPGAASRYTPEQLALLDLRKHVGWYLQGYPVGGQLRRRLMACATIDELEAAIRRLDPELRPLPGSESRPRGKTSGPRRVVLPDGWLDDRDDPTPLVADELTAVSGG
jgi:nifR3 family TIM-barrel protein